MALPGHRRTSSHKRRRAAHFALKKTTLAACPKCKEPILPHTACSSCGMYAGRKVLTLKNPLAKGAKSHKHEHGHEGHDHNHDDHKAG
jgi:large subunit ribosomal protein L32